MAKSSEPVNVYLEVGKKRTLAGAVDWPGWCRGGSNQSAALQALLEYGPRYEKVLHAAGTPFHAPSLASSLKVVEEVTGNTTTDFGAPDVAPSTDAAPVDDAELRRLKEILRACWTALDSAAEAARGKELRKGPRGGGRELDGIIEHVVGAEAGYLSRLGGKLPRSMGEENQDAASLVLAQRRIILDSLDAAARGEFPAQGPRGGARWSCRFFVRRAAWHILDHVWEIEDRVV
jgi:hypothetical protein